MTAPKKGTNRKPKNNGQQRIVYVKVSREDLNLVLEQTGNCEQMLQVANKAGAFNIQQSAVVYQTLDLLGNFNLKYNPKATKASRQQPAENIDGEK